MPNLPEIIPELEQILVRFFDALDCVDGGFLDNYTFDNLTRPGKLVSKPVAGTDLSKQHLRAVLKTVIGHADSPSVIKTSDLVAKVRELLRFSPPDYRRHHDAYDLKKLRGKEWVLAFARCIPSRPGTICEVNKPPIAESVYLTPCQIRNIVKQVLAAWPRLLAVEMEGAGVARAIELAQAAGKTVSFMVLHGISDVPSAPAPEEEQRGTVERDDWKPYASAAAAAFVVGYIRDGLPEPPA